MIDSISIKNFRSYEDVHIDFHPGLNVIVGANDSGKSNIGKAIDLVVNNSPDGDDYISNSGGDCDVQLTIAGKSVGRYRDAVFNKKEKIWKAGTKNLYTLSGESEPFKAFGRGKVPEIIQQHLNLSDINIGFQFDGPFLLEKKPVEVARHYNGLVNLDIIDRSLSNISVALKREKRELKVKQELVDEKTEKLKEYDWLDEAGKNLIKLEKLEGYVKHLNSQWSELAGLIKNLGFLEQENQALQEITKHQKAVNNLETQSNKIIVKKEQEQKLFDLTNRAISFVKEDKKLKEIIKHDEKINYLIELSNQINSGIDQEEILEKYIALIKQHQKDDKWYRGIAKYSDETKALLVLNDLIAKGVYQYNTLQELYENGVKLDEQYNKTGDLLITYEKEFVELMPDQCPLCGK